MDSFGPILMVMILNPRKACAKRPVHRRSVRIFNHPWSVGVFDRSVYDSIVTLTEVCCCGSLQHRHSCDAPSEIAKIKQQASRRLAVCVETLDTSILCDSSNCLLISGLRNTMK